MNFLQLTQRLVVECGSSAQIPTTVGQTGEAARFVNWINDAWTDIQMDHDDWSWMRASHILGSGVAFQTLDGVYSYPLGTGPGTVGVDPEDLGKWDERTFRDFTTTVGIRDEIFLRCIDFDNWRDSYMWGAQQTVKTRPIVMAIGPDLSVNLGPPPNGLYTVSADYFRTPSTMEADTDIPLGIPSRFHMLIIYRGMKKYAGYESAAEVYQRATEEDKGMTAQLEALRAPRIGWAGALA